MDWDDYYSGQRSTVIVFLSDKIVVRDSSLEFINNRRLDTISVDPNTTHCLSAHTKTEWLGERAAAKASAPHNEAVRASIGYELVVTGRHLQWLIRSVIMAMLE